MSIAVRAWKTVGIRALTALHGRSDARAIFAELAATVDPFPLCRADIRCPWDADCRRRNIPDGQLCGRLHTSSCCAQQVIVGPEANAARASCLRLPPPWTSTFVVRGRIEPIQKSCWWDLGIILNGHGGSGGGGGKQTRSQSSAGPDTML